MVDKSKSAEKGFVAAILALIPTLIVMLSALPPEQAIYSSITIGVVVGILKIVQDVIKHWND